MCIRYKRIFFLACALLLSSVASAYEVDPIRFILSPSGAGSTQDVKIINKGSVPVAIEVSMVSRHQNPDGTERRQPAGSQFLLYPEQMVIKPRSTQKVRIQWLGNTQISQELSFRNIIRQVPVNLEYANAAPRALDYKVTMEGAVYIRPKNAKSNIVVSKGSAQHGKLQLSLTNRGNAHAVMRYVSLSVLQAGRTFTVNGDAVKKIDGENVLAGVTRNFSIPLPKGVQPNVPLTATIKYSEAP